MESSLTPDINARNIDNVRRQIVLKNESLPYIPTIEQTGQVLTDYDSFPYNRWFRGVYYSPDPIVAEREAGWRPRHDSCYKLSEPPSKPEPYPNHCFQTSCNTIYPCYPDLLKRWSDRQMLDTLVNNACVVQYR